MDEPSMINFKGTQNTEWSCLRLMANWTLELQQSHCERYVQSSCPGEQGAWARNWVWRRMESHPNYHVHSRPSRPAGFVRRLRVKMHKPVEVRTMRDANIKCKVRAGKLKRTSVSSRDGWPCQTIGPSEEANSKLSRNESFLWVDYK